MPYEESASMSCFSVGPPLYVTCGPGGNGPPVGPSNIGAFDQATKPL
jgi:hypothetical protein